jgi:hypothetical protein
MESGQTEDTEGFFVVGCSVGDGFWQDIVGIQRSLMVDAGELFYRIIRN